MATSVAMATSVVSFNTNIVDSEMKAILLIAKDIKAEVVLARQEQTEFHQEMKKSVEKVISVLQTKRQTRQESGKLVNNTYDATVETL